MDPILIPFLLDLCSKKILIPDNMGDQPTEETQFVVDEVVFNALYTVTFNVLSKTSFLNRFQM